MASFLEDVRAQGDVVRRVLAAYRGDLAPMVSKAAAILAAGPDRPVLVVGMGSSLSAGRILPSIFAERSRLVVLADAGELLHYEFGGATGAGAVLAISQSGLSYETVRAVERLRRQTEIPVVALTNDPDSRLAAASDVTLPLLAGSEAAVATKTYVAATVALLLIAGEALDGAVDLTGLDTIGAAMTDAALDERIGRNAAARLGGSRALVVVARGPALGVAQYAALTIKETAAVPAEAMSGGSFRHGPLELTTSDVGVVVLAPAGRTADLGVALAMEVAERGGDVWLLTDEARAGTLSGPPTLLTTPIPTVPEPLASLACLVPLQLAAAELARASGREAGVTVVATKVTERE